MSKQFWAVIIAVVIILAGILLVTKQDAKAPGGGNSSQATNHIEGQGKAGVTLVEYGDYQCPACGEYYQPLQQVFAKYSKQIFLQFRNYPLTSIHPNSFAAARAAEAAGMQNKYWQMHDMLYQENVAYYSAQQAGQSYSSWIGASDPLSFFTQYAKTLGLNVAKFKQDYASSAVNSAINADMAAGNKFNISGTPTYVLDGKKIASPTPTVEAFSAVLDAEIAKKEGKTAPKTSAPSSGTQTAPQSKVPSKKP